MFLDGLSYGNSFFLSAVLLLFLDFLLLVCFVYRIKLITS